MRISILFLIVLFFSGMVILAQEPLIHLKKIYVSPQGRIFVQKSLPLYLRLATSPDENAPTTLLKSEVTTKYSNPMYLDTEGYNTFRAPSQVDTITKIAKFPVEDIIFEVYADSRAPRTSVKFGNAKTFSKKGKMYIKGNVNLVLHALDEMSGVETTYYSVNGENFKVVSGDISFSEEKEYVIKFYSVDNVGNVEEVKSIILVIDKTSPKTSMLIKGDNYENIFSARTSIGLVSEDLSSGLTRIFYDLDDQGVKPYKSTFRASYLSQGEHKLVYYAEDNSGNLEEQHIFEFYVDKTAPTLVQEVVGKTFFANGKEFSSGRAQLKITTFDNKAGVKEVYYSINNQEYQLYDKPVYLASASGNISIKTYAIDFVNNKVETDDQNSKTSVPFIDLSGPMVKHSFSGPVFVFGDTVFISAKTKIILKANDPDAGMNRIEYQRNGGEALIYSDPFVVTEPGKHNLAVTGYDNVENSSNYNFSFLVDLNGPDIYETFSTVAIRKQVFEGEELNVYPSHLVLFIAGTDVLSGFNHFLYTVNNQPEKAFNGNINGFNKAGKYSVKIRAFDKLGNATEKTIQFVIGV